jgi:hypothetical protein
MAGGKYPGRGSERSGGGLKAASRSIAEAEVQCREFREGSNAASDAPRPEGLLACSVQAGTVVAGAGWGSRKAGQEQESQPWRMAAWAAARGSAFGGAQGGNAGSGPWRLNAVSRSPDPDARRSGQDGARGSWPSDRCHRLDPHGRCRRARASASHLWGSPIGVAVRGGFSGQEGLQPAQGRPKRLEAGRIA